MKTCLTVIIAVAVLGGGIFFFVMKMTGVLVESADSFFAKLTANQLREAYDSTSKTCQKTTDFKNFEAVVKRVGLDKYQSASWSKRNINNDQGQIEGTVKRQDGQEFPMQIDFEKQEGQWRILGFRVVGALPPPPAGYKEEQPAASIYSADGKVPPTEQLNAMVNDTMLAFDEAVHKKDFSALRDQMAKPMQEKHTAAELLDAFRGFVDKGADLSDLKGKTPTYPTPPTIEDSQFGKMLNVEAAYELKNESVKAAITYIEENGKWRLGPIKVNADAKKN